MSKRFCYFFFVPFAESPVFRDSHLRESNPKPITYEAIALPIELRWRRAHYTQGLCKRSWQGLKSATQEHAPSSVSAVIIKGGLFVPSQ